MRRSGMSMRLFFVVLSVAALTASPAMSAGEASSGSPGPVAGGNAAAPAKKAAEPQAPVKISADTAEYFNTEGLVVFTGNVVAVQADTTLSADRMEMTFDKPTQSPAQSQEKPATGIGAPANAQRITKIVAEKKVSFRQIDPESGKERYATGEKGVYDVEQRLVTMSGNPRLWEGKNVIVGDEMTFSLGDKKVIVKGKVNLTVFPDEMKEEKKP